MKIILVSLAVLASGCSTFTLGTVHPTGQTALQQQADILTCKDEAAMAVNRPGQYAKEFALGFTLVGYPAAVASDKAKQRSVFDACMSARGYTVSH